MFYIFTIQISRYPESIAAGRTISSRGVGIHNWRRGGKTNNQKMARWLSEENTGSGTKSDCWIKSNEWTRLFDQLTRIHSLEFLIVWIKKRFINKGQSVQFLEKVINYSSNYVKIREQLYSSPHLCWFHKLIGQQKEPCFSLKWKIYSSHRR